MLSALLIMAFVYPVVYGIRRFIFKEPKFTGDVDGDQNTQPKVAVALGVALGLGIAALAILLALGTRDQSAISITFAGTLLIAYRFMRS